MACEQAGVTVYSAEADDLGPSRERPLWQAGLRLCRGGRRLSLPLRRAYLPNDRAEGCADEYEQVIKALNTLIGPYIDQTRAKQVRAEPRLRFDVQ